MARSITVTIVVAAVVGVALGVAYAVRTSSAPQVALDGAAPPAAAPIATRTAVPAPAPAPDPPDTASEAGPEPELDREEAGPDVEPESEPAPEPQPEPAPDPGPDLRQVQQRLTELGYYVAGVDGEEGPATTSAVMAFQKVNGLVADGVIGPQTLAALDDPVVPQVRDRSRDHVEVDLDLQVAYWIEDGELARIMPVSSGSGQTYRTADGGSATSLTPVGTYTIERTIEGVREAPLGTLYDPMYFYRGWALHGSGSVPAHPASHGCVRLTRADARWLFERAGVGTTVMLYGGEHTFTPDSAAATTAGAGS